LGIDKESDSKQKRPGQDEAVCFTAGPKGAAFGAGAVHAWLASDRLPPLVSAGISTGALSAAAMRKSFQQLEGARVERLEEVRWTWFRRYLDAVTVSPLDFIWKSFPDPVDFFADKPPVHDLSTDLLREPLKSKASEARRHFHILTKFGIWLGGVPVRVRTMACILVYYVRYSESYSWRPFSLTLLFAFIVKASAGLWWHLVRSPKFFSERSFRQPFWNTKKSPREKRWIIPFRPLFGWAIWMSAIVVPMLFVWVEWRVIQTPTGHPFLALAIETFAIVAGCCLLARSRSARWLLPRHLLRQLDVTAGVLSPFELRRRIHDLFGEDDLNPRLPSGLETHALLVSAVLQRSEQVWPNEDVPLVVALTAALSVPGIFPPETVDARGLANYSGRWQPQIIDGVAVRNNPIPAFFQWCKSHSEIARRLENAGGASLHVVYNVPIRPKGSIADAPPREWIDIVEAAKISRALEKRRDTRQEVRQTYFISRLEGYRRLAVGPREQIPAKFPRFRIVADEVAPQEEINFSNAWQPARDESLKIAAQGCRETLETLYSGELKSAGEEGMACVTLLCSLAPRRGTHIQSKSPGLPEVCGACTRTLHYRPAHVMLEEPPGVIRSYGQSGEVSNLALRTKLFPHLAGERPRIVFLGNGGVFRGAFHIGVIAGLKAARVFPDLVVGASVGMLMGGALASISVAEPAEEGGLLEDLADTFLNVDKRVALTRTLKNAAKQLGIRSRQIRLAPSEVRRKVLSGSRADPGYAATGAPPALIDAISSLFMIPHRRTAAIASDFVAGHFSEAANRFLREVRKETLTSLGIERSCIGISLLAERAIALLGGCLPQVKGNETQPWHYPAEGKRPVSVFGTTSFLNARTALLLGRDFLTPDPSWDSVFAGLSSSAFPAVFSPRSEADVLPGRGRPDRLFADGGLFDNLPFFPAIEILGAVQSAEFKPNLRDVLNRLRSRTEHRDVFIAAALDASPKPGGEYDTLFRIYSRSRELAANSKADSFEKGSEQTREALEQIVACSETFLRSISPEEHDLAADFLDRSINAAVLKVIPADKDHINPTFAFCRAMGMKQKTVATSIADGCFQSLRQLSQSWATDTTIHKAFENTLVAQELRLDGKLPVGNKDCPFFVTDQGRLPCPFGAAKADHVRHIRDICAKDPVHKRLAAPPERP
jgi:predicted acylesterase/phospholipase RssA